MGLDIKSTAGWPYPSLRKSCVDFTPSTNLAEIPFGKSKIKMQANDGANHIGPCTVYLYDQKNSQNTLKVGFMDNCWRSLHPDTGVKGETIPAEMEIDIPDTGLPCDPSYCVLRFHLEATHLYPTVENFDSCADVRLGTATSPTLREPSPSPLNPTPSSTTLVTIDSTPIASPSTTTATNNSNPAPAPGPDGKVKPWGQCGGTNHYGPTDCERGYSCENHQCVPTPPGPGELQSYAQCGGKDYTGGTQCKQGDKCVELSEWFSLCKPEHYA
jgi:hypothetical protein